ncbi:MAG: hypothetical protein JXA74_04575, partial [Anaerolineae bacterium]|nr:hypothetical protein [Anaerolineae bacterium]
PRLAFAEGEVPALEAPLNQEGQAFELHLDGLGRLWISDYNANEIWQVNPETGACTLFGDLDAPSDAQMDASGQVWWTNPDDVLLGRLSPGSGTVTLWSLEEAEAYSLLGLAFDEAGHVWLTNSFDARFHRFDPATSELCTYELPQLGASEYVTVQEGAVWFGDWRNGAIVRFEPASGQLRWWPIAGEGSWPVGLAFDDDGRLWWADNGLGAVVSLDPARMLQTTYLLPDAGAPESISVGPYGWVWYAGSDGSLGTLNALYAEGTSQTVTPQTHVAALEPTCIVLEGTTASATVTPGTLDWSPVTLASSGASGWIEFGLPRVARLRGLEAGETHTWVIDSETQRLVSIPFTPPEMHRLTLPVVYNNRVAP